MIRLIESSTSPLAKKGNSPIFLAGEFATFDVRNQNNRVYPRDLYEKALTDLMPKVKTRQCLGECDHPLDYDEVRLSNVSHLITDLRVEGNKVYGEVELLNTPAGKVVQALVEAGVPIGISSRAVGDVITEGDQELVQDLSLITYDLVADPSFKTAVLSEVSKSKLGESLKLVESRLPSCNSKSTGTVRTLIKEIRESLLTDSSVGVSDKSAVSKLEIEALQRVSESQMSKIKTLSEGRKVLATEVRRLSKSLKEMRTKYADSSTRLSSLTSRMHRLQEAYNTLVETTVSRKDYEVLMAETVELRKKLAVESRGLSYSQVRDLLEGAMTEGEITSRLAALKGKRSSTVLKDLNESSTIQDESLHRARGSRLSGIISRI